MKLLKYTGFTLLFLALSLVLNTELVAVSASSAPTGKLAGLILDANEAVVPAAKITVEGKRFKREIITTEDGSFEIELPEGKYKIKVEHDWFYPLKKKNIRVSSGVTTKLDTILKVGKRVDESHP